MKLKKEKQENLAGIRKNIRILLVMPDGRIHKLKLTSDYSISFREAPLTLTTLAALVPEDIEARVTVVDESVDEIPMDKTFDLVGISCLTGTSTRAYEIADYFKSRGSTIILGGIHVSLMPDEAMSHSDSIVVGYGEEKWPELLMDFVRGKLKKKYIGIETSLKNYVLPKLEFQKKGSYMSPNVVFATRGCKGKCSFCSIPAAGIKWDTRPVGEVIDQIRNFKGNRFAFNDVSLLEDLDYARELFTAMIPLKKKWGGLCTSKIALHDDILDLMEKSGCIFLLIGLESMNTNSLKRMNKNFNKPINYSTLVTKLHDKNIVLMGTMIFGTDNDTTDIFKDTVEMVNELKIDIPRYAIYTPYPGITIFDRLEKENRLLHKRWEHYDTQHVVFRPKLMTPEELEEGFMWAYKKTFTVKSIFNRTIELKKRFPFTFMGNLAYRIYLRRLANEKNRILFH